MNKINAEVKYGKQTTKEELMKMKAVNRMETILEIQAVEKLKPEKDGIELNEGYNYTMNGSIPQVADGIAKMAIEMDKLEEMGSNAGKGFIILIEQYYKKATEEQADRR